MKVSASQISEHGWIQCFPQWIQWIPETRLKWMPMSLNFHFFNNTPLSFKSQPIYFNLFQSCSICKNSPAS